MSILGVFKKYRGLKRSQVILRTFTRYGFGHLAQRLHLGVRLSLTKLMSRKKAHRDEQGGRAVGHQDVAIRMRHAFEELGPTFVKLGQLLSGRPDLIDEPYLSEFKKLQDRVAPFPTSEARRIVTESLGRPVDEVFSEFSPDAVASGSIAQVHYAVTADGRPVVVKVKRPGIERTMMTDLYLLQQLAGQVERHIPESRSYQPQEVIDEFGNSIKRELDFITEAAATEQFSELVNRCPGMRVPAVFWEISTPDVLVLERISGNNITQDPRVADGRVDRRKLARRLAECFFRQYFSDGIFHADPHPGNLMLTDEGEIGLVDFGNVGRLSPTVISYLGELLRAIYERDFETIVRIGTELGSTSRDTDFNRLVTDMIPVLDKYFGMPLKYIDHKQLFHEVTAVANRNNLILPRDLVLLGKSFVTLMSTVEWLDPDCDLTRIASPFARSALLRRFSPKKLALDAQDMANEMMRLSRETPRAVRQLLRNAVKGELQVQFKHTNLDNVVLDIDRSVNRLSLSILTGAIVVGSSLVADKNLGVPYVGLIGFGFAFVLSVVLILGILNSGKL